MGAVGEYLLKAAIGVAIAAEGNVWFGNTTKSSATYSFGTLQTQANSTAPIPLIYGKVKCAGNSIWQTPGDNTVTNRLVAFGDGEIKGFSEVKLNNIDISTLDGCNYTAYVGNGTQEVDSRVPGIATQDNGTIGGIISGPTEAVRAALVGGLKYDAYLAITATAGDKLSGDFNVTAVVEGRLVQKYKLNAADARGYSADGAKAWSDNPAWCILDFLTAYNGVGLPEEQLDIPAFISAAAYCDAQPAGGADGEKRFTLNYIIDERKSRLDILQDMLVVCRGYLTYQRGKTGILIEKAEEVAQVFYPEQINDLQLWWSSLEDTVDILRLQFIDPENEWTKVYAQAEAETSVRDGKMVFSSSLREQPFVKEINAYGVTNFPQASRLAWYYQNQSILCPQWVQFNTNRYALNRTIGDVIEVCDYVFAQRLTGTAVVTADSDLVLGSGTKFKTEVAVGNRIRINGIYQRVIEVLDDTRLRVQVAFTESGSGFDIILFKSKEYRIMSMSEAQGGKIELKCHEYNENIYSDTRGSAAPYINIVGNDRYKAPSAVSGLSWRERVYKNIDGSYNRLEDIAWNASTENVTYTITFSYDDGETWLNFMAGLTQPYFKGISAGSHWNEDWLISVEAVSKVGIHSQRAIVKVTADALDGGEAYTIGNTYLFDIEVEGGEAGDTFGQEIDGGEG